MDATWVDGRGGWMPFSMEGMEARPVTGTRSVSTMADTWEFFVHLTSRGQLDLPLENLAHPRYQAYTE